MWVPSPGATLGGRYEVRAELGSGGIARVWRARDARTGETVAVKGVRTDGDLYRDDPALARDLFETEVETLRAVGRAGGHPNVVGLRDVVAERGARFAVVDAVEGVVLDDPAVDLPEPEARRVAAELADAMAFLHRNEVIYRDLKPDNAMLRPDGSPVLIDFNTAKGVDPDLSPAPACPACGARVDATDLVCPACDEPFDGSADTCIGRPNEIWRPPELVEDRAHLRQGPWTDVYALGKLFFALLAGPDRRVPAHPGAGPLDSRTDPVDCHPANDEIVRRATRERYDERYRNAEVLRRVLVARDPQPPASARLVDRRTGETHAVSPGDTVGRRGAEGPDATIRVDDDTDHVSAVHVQFDTTESGEWLLRDPRSTNGTYVRQDGGWCRVLSDRGARKRRAAGEADWRGDPPPDTVRLRDGATVALVHPSVGAVFEFRRA
jgi:protein kinase/serine/threonine-protein kinase